MRTKNISWPEVFWYDCYKGHLSVTSNFPGINLFKAERVWGQKPLSICRLLAAAVPAADPIIFFSYLIWNHWKITKRQKGWKEKKTLSICWNTLILKSAIAAVQENWPKPNKLERICLLNENLICYLKYEVFQNSNGMLQEGRKGGRDKNAFHLLPMYVAAWLPQYFLFENS